MIGARRYAGWPDPRSRSRALQSRKSSHFQKPCLPPFTKGAGNWPLILKPGHSIKICSGRICDICHSFCVTWLWSWQKCQLRRVVCQSCTGPIVIIIRLEAMLWANIGFTLRGSWVLFTRSAITQPKVNAFEWNLEHSEYIVGGWPWQILGTIRTVVTVWEAGEIFFGLVNNARFRRFPVGNISQNLNTTVLIVVAVNTFGTEVGKFYRKGLIFPKMQKFLTNF